MEGNSIIIATLVAYKLLLLGIGFWASRRVDSEGDFFLAGQGLGAWTAGLSYAASTSSAWVLLGFTGMVFTQGLVALWLVPGIFGGYVLTWLVMGPRLNAETRERGHITVIDFLVTDADRWARLIGLLAAGLILFCFVFYIAAQFQAAGNALTEVFGMSATEAILLGAAVILIYCLLGGFLAASITDALQAGVMVLACIIVPIAALSAAGGLGAVMDALRANEPQSYFSLTGSAFGMAGIGMAMGLLGTGLGALGQPQLLNRIMAVRSQTERVRGAAITIGWGVLIYSGLVVLALSGRAMSLDTGGESLFFAAASAYLPAAIAGVVIAAVLSAVMSTVDSLLLAAASAVSHDSGLRWGTPKRALLMGRLAMVAVALFAVGLTLFAPKDIFTRVLFSWVALGAAFGPAILTRCLGWRVRGGAVFCAVIVGFVAAVIAYNIPGPGADVVEKWGSWALGLIILAIGRVKHG
ncbi:sodium/proline symporter [Algimonas porphyrae]|uniref:Sodium/proline symporter n=1 Tax=Algimonas porphyrae TaxID=1128113 RepID=A0ABQ5UXK8_9PROT|nr:sodium/proline symporter [Algimonas porphyrae]GLQ19587.1 sodium:proline symporter [Algimonas porphyrae]